jgi:hypothetical protein
MTTQTKTKAIDGQANTTAAPGTYPVAHPAPVSDAASLLAVISRGASDPTMDISKLERLTAMYEQIVTRQAEGAFNIAMSVAQSQMGRIATDSSNPSTRSRYASYGALDRAVRPIYTQHGFALTFGTGDAPAPEMIRVVCDVSLGGFTRRYHVDMPADGRGAKGGEVMTRTHATGSAITYGRRYLLAMIFNLATGEDDDGNRAGDTGAKLSKQQIENLRDRLTAINPTAEDKFLNYARAERFEDLSAAKYDSYCEAIEVYASKVKAPA